MKCREISEELLAARRGESDHQSEVYAHLADCADCREMADRMGRALAVLDKVGDFEPRERVWNGVSKALEADGASPPRRLSREALEIHKRIPAPVRLVAAVVLAAAAISIIVYSYLPWRSRPIVGTAGHTGAIHLKRGGEGVWETLSPGRLLSVNDHIGTSDRGGDILLSSGVSVRLHTKTLLELLSPHKIYMGAGRVYVAARPGGGEFTIDTGAAAVKVLGTRFDVMVLPDATRVTVVEGEVILSNKRGAVTIGPGMTASAARGEAPRRPVRCDPAKAIGWALRSSTRAPDLGLSLSRARVKTGTALTAIIEVANNTGEPVEAYTAGDVQPFYMFRITRMSGSRPARSWTIQATPLATPGDIGRDHPKLVNLDRGEKYTAKCDLTGITRSPGRYEVSAVYYSYPTKGATDALWTGTTTSRPVAVEVTEAQ